MIPDTGSGYGGKHTAEAAIEAARLAKAAGKPVTKAATTLPPVAVQLAAQDHLVLWNTDMLERVRAGGAQIVYARTPREYTGEDIRAVRGGHVPGALNIPYEENWRDPQTASKLARKLRAFPCSVCRGASCRWSARPPPSTRWRM